MAQFGRPATDITDGTWTTDTGSTALATAIDETSANDSDYIQSAIDPANDTVEIALGPITDPGSSAGHVFRYRIGKTGTDPLDMTVSLRQGASTEIASWVHTNVSSTITTITQTLTGPQADAITNYADLRLRFVADVGGTTAPDPQSVFLWLNNYA